MIGLIYIIKNKLNNKTYVGQTTYSLNQRMSSHKNKAFKQKLNYPLYNSMRKYGIENFEWKILKESNDLDKAECFFINKFNSIEDGYNIRDGGNNSFHSPETKRKISHIKKKYFKNKHNHPMYGKHHSEEVKNKIRLSIGKSTKGEKNPFYGKKHSKEVIEKIKNARKKQKSTWNKKWNLIDPNDNTVVIYNLKEFCDYNGLSYIAMKMCSYGKQKQHNGWRVE